jgi:hypothetical protein
MFIRALSGPRRHLKGTNRLACLLQLPKFKPLLRGSHNNNNNNNNNNNKTPFLREPPIGAWLKGLFGTNLTQPAGKNGRARLCWLDGGGRLMGVFKRADAAIVGVSQLSAGREKRWIFNQATM